MDNEFMMICGMYRDGKCPMKHGILAGIKKCDYAHEHYQGDDCDEVCTYGGRCVPVNPGVGPGEQASNLEEYLLTKDEIDKAALIPAEAFKRIINAAAAYAKGNHKDFRDKQIELAQEYSRSQIIKAQHEKTLEKAGLDIQNQLKLIINGDPSAKPVEFKGELKMIKEKK
jgi:hypothetical protein